MNYYKEKTMDFKLKEIRIKRGLTLQELSRLSNVHLQTIHALESGKTDSEKATIGTMLRLAKALKCKVRDFYPSEKNL